MFVACVVFELNALNEKKTVSKYYCLSAHVYRPAEEAIIITERKIMIVFICTESDGVRPALT